MTCVATLFRWTFMDQLEGLNLIGKSNDQNVRLKVPWLPKLVTQIILIRMNKTINISKKLNYYETCQDKTQFSDA